MRTEVDCLPCFIRQSLQVARVAEASAEVQIRVVQKIAAIVAELDVTLSPPANAGKIYQAIAEITDCEDPYRQLKSTSNGGALKILPALRREIETSAYQLTTALRFVIAGNCIDYGAFASVDIENALDQSRRSPFAVDHSAQLQSRIAALQKGATVLYLADNSGEIVYDRLLIEYLLRHDLVITVAVKDGPIINDALVEDARAAGLDKLSRIISNGSRCPGTVLSQCSAEFGQIFKSADLIISKGQGNFESLSEVDREIYFLLMLKCAVAARHLAELAGVDPAKLPGNGEMVVYCSKK
ncbi:MAG: ARMT1-like domain-containing protein [Pseudomonadota bacterium]